MEVFAQKGWAQPLKRILANRLDPEDLEGSPVAAILGDAPSTYAKSPRLWNAGFQALGLPALYVAFDVPPGRLKELVAVLREADSFLGGSVTVPYKMEILPLIDEVDPLAARIGAVNTLVRTPQGRLLGYNTDGSGGVKALTQPLRPGERPLINSLKNARVVLLGAGGAAQALAFFLAQEIGPEGRLAIVNRSEDKAQALASRIRALQITSVESFPEEKLPEALSEADLILNATTRGQAGWRSAGQRRWTCLEPYSSLAPACPAVVGEEIENEPERWSRWFELSRADILRNQEISMERIARVPARVAFCDIVYAPLETVFLRQARLSGHATLNGKPMNIFQALEAFWERVCPALLNRHGLNTPQAHRRLVEAVLKEWG